MGNTFFFEWEVRLMEWLQANMGGVGEALAKFFSMFGEELLLVAILGFIYWCWDKKYGLFVGLNLVVVSVWNPMIKNIALRLRPYFVHDSIKCLKPVDAGADIYDVTAQGYSFPSGHSSSSAATYGAIAAYGKKKLFVILACCLTFLVGFSRFCLGVHYPTDVLCGWALGLIVLLVISWLSKKIQREWVLHLILLIIGLPGFFYCTTTDFYSSYGMLLGLMFGALFEKRFVKFENTRKPLFLVLRLIGGIAIYFALNTVLKLPFSSEFRNAATLPSFLVRTLRYAIVIFTVLGLYPILFRLEKKLAK